MPKLMFWALGATMWCVSPVLAQTQSFEVVSIRPNNSGSRASRTSSGPDGSLKATNTNLRELIRLSYDLFDYQLVGGPDWINTARFDVEAKAEAGLAEPDVLAMTRSLLEDRVHLKVHRETRELPIFLLTPSKDGPKLQQTVEGRPGPGGLKPGMSRRSATGAGGEMSGSGISMAKLIEGLVSHVGRPISDRTNLAGTFDFVLKWSGVAAPAGSDAPSLFTALEEQLGLKLEPSKGPVEVLVIDSVDKPTEN